MEYPSRQDAKDGHEEVMGEQKPHVSMVWPVDEEMSGENNRLLQKIDGVRNDSQFYERA